MEEREWWTYCISSIKLLGMKKLIPIKSGGRGYLLIVLRRSKREILAWGITSLIVVGQVFVK